MKRILEVLATLKRAGAETMVATLVERLDQSRFEPLVVSLYDAFEGGLEERIERAGVAVRHLGKRRGFDPRLYGRLRAVVREFRPHVIHTHSYVLRYTLPVARCAMVHTVHNLAEREVDAVGRMVHRLAYAVGVTPVAVAAEVAQSFTRIYGFEPEVIPNGIDTEQFPPREYPSRVPVRVLSVARLEPQKNPALLARALPPGCELWLAGEGSLRPQLEGLPNVRLLGVRRDIAALLAEADLFALASDWEGHPLALLEAMAAGLPVVATAVGGVPGIVADAGLLVPPGDAAALRRALERLAEDAPLRAAMGARARQRAAQFDVRKMVKAYEELFERVARR